MRAHPQHVRNLVVLNVSSLKKGRRIGAMDSPDGIRAKLRAANSPVNRWLMILGVGQLSGHLTFLIIDSVLIAMIARLRRKPRLPVLCSSLLRRMDQDVGLHRIPLHVL